MKAFQLWNGLRKCPGYRYSFLYPA